jgi:hypothetical protein
MICLNVFVIINEWGHKIYPSKFSIIMTFCFIGLLYIVATIVSIAIPLAIVYGAFLIARSFGLI